MWLGDIADNRRIFIQVREKDKGSAVKTFPQFPLFNIRVVKSGVWAAHCCIWLAVTTLEDQSLPRVVIWKIIPLKIRIVKNLKVFGHEVVEYHVAGHDVFGVYGACIAKAKGPVV